MLELAIALEEVRNSNRLGQPLLRLPKASLTVGSHFLESANKNQAGPASKYGHLVLETCARLAIGQPKGRVSNFTRAGGAVRRPSDGAIAKRTHLSKSHEALRLMFWETDDGLEFANVGPKNELEIFE